MPARILLVDDHPLVRRGLSNVIQEEPDLEVCGEAGDSVAALAELERTKPDVVIVDISLGDASGVDLIRTIKQRAPGVKALVCSMHEEEDFAELALRAGAEGFVNKQKTPSDLVQAIRQVLQGRFFFTDAFTENILRHVSGGGARSPSGAPHEVLSEREMQVFNLIGRGQTTRQIAKSLNVCVKTVETHRQNMKKKLKLNNSAQLVQQAVKWVLTVGQR